MRLRENQSLLLFIVFFVVLFQYSFVSGSSLISLRDESLEISSEVPLNFHVPLEESSQIISEVPLNLHVSLEAKTYNDIMKQFKLKKYYLIRNMNLESIVEKRTLVNLIANNFIEAHFFRWNHFFNRNFSSDILEKADRFNKEILYDLMKEFETLNFLGYKLCFVIIDTILKEFSPRVTFFNDNLKNLFQSVSLHISDFLEFILNNLIPTRQNHSLSLFDELSVENESFEVMKRAVTMAEISKFQNAEMLEVILKKYSKYMSAQNTQFYINDAKKYLKFKRSIFIFRQVFTLLVKMTPEYFIAARFTDQYINNLGEYVSITIHLANMAPIFRALMMVEPQEYQETYLETYHNRICPNPNSTAACFKSLDSFRALDILIADSDFSLCSSLEMSNKKSDLLAKILLQYFGLCSDHYFELAKKCIVNGFLPLYEVLLQHFSAVFLVP